MTLFSESGILSVKTGGQQEIAQMEEQEKQRLLELPGNMRTVSTLKCPAFTVEAHWYTTWEMLWEL